MKCCFFILNKNVKVAYTIELMDQIIGYIERITFHNPENGFTIAKMQLPKNAELTCIVGIMPSIQPGETMRCFGSWKRHLIHGLQFEVVEHQVETPADLNGIQKYLGSGLIRGIGPVYAKRIVEEFGIDTLHIIDKFPEKLRTIAGIGEKRLKKITTCWSEQKSIREVMIFLQANGVSPAYAQKIFRTYGDKSIQVVKENPYRLARDIHGIGFKSADKIAEKIGIAKESPQRIDAGILYALSKLSEEGHVCFPADLFIEEAGKMLEVEPPMIQERLEGLQKEEEIVIKEQVYEAALQKFLWIKSLYISERGIAKELYRLHHGRSQLREVDEMKAVDWVQKTLNITLGDNQQAAVKLSMREKVQIITGGPGTGKSTITNAILTITEKLTDAILLAAPTGRAAKRMSEITGKKAYTIHSLLEFDFKTGGFKKNRETPLVCHLLIVDEASMIDTQLMYSLLKAIPTHARVIFVGDVDQLPSVGPGNVLKELITSHSVPVTQLKEIYRQAAGSQIITNSHKINKGLMPDLKGGPESDFFFVEEEDKEALLNQIVTLVTQRIPKKYRFDPIDEIQVLAPMKKGVVGTENLNAVLQQALNPKEDALFRYGRRFAAGDKVMQIRNNYDRNVYNGDVGRILKLDHVEQRLIVRMDEKEVEYPYADLDELVLAYAVSIHKYQGSECSCVVIPVHTTHFKMLHRNLLYTGVTRGKKLVILCGTKKALFIAVKNDEVKKRYTGLLTALLETMNLARI